MSQTELVKDLSLWNSIRKTIDGRTLGFVPTMGALHEGHASLARRARLENDVVVMSIYVNPTQFNDPKDLEKYPSTLERDLEIASACGVDYVIAPTYPQIYPDGYRYKVSENDLSTKLCGAHRPGHFDGVLTVVLKLLNLVQADRAYFGEKDYQQLELIRGMAQAFFIPTRIVGCPTVREADGLAMSSRNVNLPSAAREIAPAFAASLKGADKPETARAQLESKGFEVDYIEDIGKRRYGAVRIGGVRLIDNVER